MSCHFVCILLYHHVKKSVGKNFRKIGGNCTRLVWPSIAFTYTGFAFVVGTTCALSVPTAMAWSFVCIVIPNSDAYLASRYSAEFPAYAKRTPTLVPFVQSRLAMQGMAWAGFVAAALLGANCAGSCTRAP